MKKIVLILGCILYVASASAFAGLRASFADMILANMKPGMVYSLQQEQDLSYTVTNESRSRSEVEVVVKIPKEEQMREGFEPIPDPAWVTVFPSDFTLEPGEKIDCDIIISIPDEEKYEGRHFQAMLVSGAGPKPGAKGVTISFALATRLRFSTGPRPEEVLAEYRERILSALDMEMMPMSLFVKDSVPVGEQIRFDGFDRETPQIINRSREDYEMEFELAKKMRDYGIASDYEPLPEEATVSIKTEKLEIRPRSINDVVLDIEIPDAEEFRDRRYAFVVIGRVVDFDIPIELFSRVYFKTEE